MTEAFLSLPLKLPMQDKIILYLSVSYSFQNSSSWTPAAFWKRKLFQLQKLTDLTAVNFLLT